MTELKTLKDIDLSKLEFREKRASEYLIENLRQEAIKWVKSIRGKRLPAFYPSNCRGEAVIRFIEEFFNLDCQQVFERNVDDKTSSSLNCHPADNLNLIQL